MALLDYVKNVQRCTRCSLCKWVPGPLIKSAEFAQICPSISKYNFHAFSGGGRNIIALSLLKGRLELSENLLDILYKCQLCGSCDINCRMVNNLVEPLDVMRELRIMCVTEGYILPQQMAVFDGLKKEDNMMQKPKAERGNWAAGLDVKDLTKEKSEVAFHVGCRLAFDAELASVPRITVTLLKQAGIDFGIMGKDEICCSGRAYNMGYVGELIKYAESNWNGWRSAGVKKIIVACGDCYGTFQNLYPKVLNDMDFKIIHISQYLEQLIKEGKLRLNDKKTPMRVTYQDPCNLGRLGEHYPPWKGVEKVLPGPVIVFDPPKPPRYGINGVYDSPRNLMKSITGIQLVEMQRIREHAWCCGAGGGVIDNYPDFALWTARERVKEAKSTGAEAIVTACPWCNRTLRDAIKEEGDNLKVIDIVELVNQAF